MSGLGPESSAIRITNDAEKRINEAPNAETVKCIMHELALAQGVVTADYYDPSVLIPTELASAAPKRFAKTLTINGTKHILESDSPEGLLTAETDVLRQALAQPATIEPAARVTEQPRNDRGQFTSPEEVARRAELELQFKRGDISAVDFLADSGALDEALAKRGVSLADLQRVAEATYQADWASATEEFLSLHPEWQGGPEITRAVGNQIIAMGLDGSPSVESLEKAYIEMKRQNRVPENKELLATKAQYDAILNANSHAEIDAALGRGSSSLFGR